MRSRILNTEDFISRSTIAHNGKYDYSKTIYVDSKTKVSIVCHEHGEFFARPSDHVSGKNGCPICAKRIIAIKNKRTTEEFISLAKQRHGDRYDYSETIYDGALKNVKIICREHGAFLQQANIHIRGANCPECVVPPFSIEKFLNKANSIHDYKYDYSKVVYKGCNEKILIQCKIHGDFMQVPSDHLKGRGCPKCAIERSAEKQKMTEAQFLDKAKKVHGDTYDYSLVEYNNYRERVKILCAIHGVFEQTPSGHLKGSGCIECSRSSGYNKTRFIKLVSRYGEGYLYLVKLYNSDEEFYKIGITCRELRKRMNCFPFSKEILHVETLYDGEDLFDLENELHRAFRKFRYSPITTFSGNKECYSEIDIELFHEVLSKYKEKL